jgi:hypothetical protein
MERARLLGNANPLVQQMARTGQQQKQRMNMPGWEQLQAPPTPMSSAPMPDEAQQAQAAREAAAQRLQQQAQPAGGRGEGAVSEFIMQNTPIASPTVRSFEAYKQGDYPSMALEGAQTAVQMAAPAVVGPIARGAGGIISTLMRTFPKASAAVGATGLTGAAVATTGESSQKLNRAQQQEVEMKRQQIEAQSKADLEKARLEAEGKAKTEETKAKAEQERLKLEADIRQRESEQKAQAVQQAEERATKQREAAEQAEREATIRERHPVLANAITAAGYTLAAIVPLRANYLKVMENRGFIEKWEQTAQAAEKAYLEGNKTAAQLQLNKLKEFQERLKKLDGSKLGRAILVANSAAFPVEIGMLPEFADAVTGTPEQKKKAQDTLLDWHRLPSAIGLGTALATAGYKWPIRKSGAAGVEAASKGLVETGLPTKARAPRKKPEPKSEPAELSMDTTLDQAARIMNKNEETRSMMK